MYKIYRIILAICACSLLVIGTTVNTCDNQVALPLDVDIANCAATPCLLARGRNISFTLSFNSPSYIEKLEPEANATTLGITVNYPLLNQEEACNFLVNTNCPLEEGEFVTYLFSLFIEPILPKITVDIAFELYDQDHVGVVCFSITGTVVDP